MRVKTQIILRSDRSEMRAAYAELCEDYSVSRSSNAEGKFYHLAAEMILDIEVDLATGEAFATRLAGIELRERVEL